MLAKDTPFRVSGLLTTLSADAVLSCGSELNLCPWQWRWIQKNKGLRAMAFAYFASASCNRKMPDTHDGTTSPVSPKENTIKEISLTIL